MAGTSSARGAPPVVKGIHHSAFICRDAEETRRFYEGVLGLEGRCALRIETRPGTDIPLEYLHLFFEMADGNFIAFFDAPKEVKDDIFYDKDGIREFHFAMEVADRGEMMAFKRHLEAHGLKIRGPIDHGFVESIYFHDPNGLQLEVTVRAPAHDAILEEAAAALDETLEKWSADMTPLRKAAPAAAAS